MDATIGAGDFKARCLRLLDAVSQEHKSLVITKRGRPVAKLIPMPHQGGLFGAMAGSVQKEEDILAPIECKWDVAK